MSVIIAAISSIPIITVTTKVVSNRPRLQGRQKRIWVTVESFFLAP